MTELLPVKHIPLDPFDSPKGWDKKVQRKAGSKDDHIRKNQKYLAKIYGHWYLGTFSEEWYGWNFNEWGRSGCQLDSIEDLYEVDLQVLEKR